MGRRIVTAVLAWAAAAGSCGAGTPKAVTVTFYHTSDLHDHSVPLPRVAQLVAARRKKDPNVLFVDTGDWCNKGDLTPLGTRGEAIVAMMSAAKYDAVIPGNHDFSFGAERLAELVDKYSLPMLSANCEWARKVEPTNTARYRIHKLRGVTVAIVGAAPPFVGAVKGPSVKILPVAAALRRLIAELDRKADIIVLLTHVGPPEDKKLIRALPRVDVLLGGHHHVRFASLEFDKRTETVLQHSGCFGVTVGEVVITWDGTRITDRKARLINITRDMPESEAVKAVREKYVPAKAPESRRGPRPLPGDRARQDAARRPEEERSGAASVRPSQPTSFGIPGTVTALRRPRTAGSRQSPPSRRRLPFRSLAFGRLRASGDTILYLSLTPRVGRVWSRHAGDRKACTADA